MVTSVQPLVDKLQSIHDRLIPLETPNSFFLTLFEYIEVFDRDQRLDPFIKTIQTQREIDFKKSKELEAKSIEEMRITYSKIKSHIKEAKITSLNLVKILGEYEAYERDDGSIESSAGPIDGRYGSLVRTLIFIAELPQESEKAFAREFGQAETEGGLIYFWTFSPSYVELEREKKYIKRMEMTKLWYCWDRFTLFYTLYRDYEKWRQQEVEKMHMFSVMGMDSMFQELQSALSYKSDAKRYLREFDVPTYKNHLERIHNYVREGLLNSDLENKELMKKLNWTYDPVSGVFYFDGKIVPLKKNSLRAKVLELLSKNDKNKKKTWSNDEVYELIEGTETDKKDSRKVYEACKGVAESIAMKCGVTDFLIYDTTTTRINPSYLE